MDKRFEIIKSFGEPLSAFIGEHVGEPRLIIALYDAQWFVMGIEKGKEVQYNKLFDLCNLVKQCRQGDLYIKK